MTTEQLTIDSFSAQIKDQSVDEIIEDVTASEEWKAEARQTVLSLCKDRAQWDLDDLAELVPFTKEKRALGQILRFCVKAGWCRISHYTKSKRKSRHYGVISVYDSCYH